MHSPGSKWGSLSFPLWSRSIVSLHFPHPSAWTFKFEATTLFHLLLVLQNTSLPNWTPDSRAKKFQTLIVMFRCFCCLWMIRVGTVKVEEMKDHGKPTNNCMGAHWIYWAYSEYQLDYFKRIYVGSSRNNTEMDQRKKRLWLRKITEDDKVSICGCLSSIATADLLPPTFKVLPLSVCNPKI